MTPENSHRVTPPSSAASPAPGKPRYILKLLGSPAVRNPDGRPVPGLGPGKSLAVLAYLAVRRRARRDELIDLLWGEIPEDKARNAFRQSLHRLRTGLGDDLLPQLRDEVELVADDHLFIDRSAFVTAVSEGRWEDAVDLHDGDFLEGMEAEEAAFDRWADGERVRLRAQFREALVGAARASASQGRVGDSLRFAERLTEAAPYDEEAAAFLINALVGAGRANQALSAGHSFIARLRDDLDLPAPQGIQSLLDRLDRRSKTSPSRSGSGESRAGGLVPFVGRERELARLVAAVEQLRSERGGALLVEGEHGSGKTRLIEEFADRVRTLGGVTILRGREPAGGMLPFASVAEALRPLVRAAGVSGASRHLLAEAARLLPELRDNFDLPDVESIDDETGRLRFFEGVAAMVDAAAYERPVCILIDDMHHASVSTVDMLSYLSHRLHTSPVLLVFAGATEGDARPILERIRALVTDRDGEVLDLEPLADDEAKTLISAIASRAESSDTVRVMRAAAGNPFKIIELARRTATGEDGSAGIATLRDTLWARFQAASPSQRRVFFAASLLGKACPLRVLAAAAHLPEEATAEATDALVHADLLRPSQAGFAVAHDVTSNFVVDASGLAGRALLAGWAADALAHEPDATAGELAALYAAAGQTERAFRYARQAAFDAAGVAAHAEVTRFLALALTFAPTADARSEIESFLSAFGRGKLALPSASQAADAAGAPRGFETTEAPSASQDEIVVEVSDSHGQRRSRWIRDAGPRQWMMAIAISIIVIATGLLARRTILRRGPPRMSGDSLFVAESDARGRQQLWAIANATPYARGSTTLAAVDRTLGWTDSLRAPWASAVASPDNKLVAVERMTAHGQDLYIISADRRDTTAVAVGGGDNLMLDWAPDSRAVLVSRSRTLVDGSFDSDLYRVSVAGGAPVPIDTSASRAVTEAKWSPNGLSIAWVARNGSDRQRDVFVAHADGSHMRNLSANAADDYGINWSPDGSLLVFSSTRSGASRLYVYDFENARLWPVSDRPGEDNGVFSPDGRALAFQAMRDGDFAIYTRPALGGTPRRITPPGRQFSIAHWGSPQRQYVDRVRIVGSTALSVGDTARLGIVGLTAAGTSLNNPTARWSVSGIHVVAPVDSTADSSAHFDLVGQSPGSARVVASLDGWRSDTVTLAVSSLLGVHLADDFASSSLESHWIVLGDPLPYVGVDTRGTGRAVYPNGDLEWDSGVLSRETIEVRSGLSVRATLFAPYTGRPSAAHATVALVNAVAEAALDRTAPRFAPLIGFAWDAAAGRLVYSVGNQSYSEPVGALGGAVNEHALAFTVGNDRMISFAVDGRVRWSASLNALGAQAGTPVQLWIGGRATTNQVAVSAVRVDASPRAGTL